MMPKSQEQASTDNEFCLFFNEIAKKEKQPTEWDKYLQTI